MRSFRAKRKKNAGKKTPSFPRQGKESDKSEKLEENQQPSKQFTILNQDNQFKWILSDDVLKYANSHFSQYIQERHLMESILNENSVPSNISEVKKLDEFMSRFLKTSKHWCVPYLRQTTTTRDDDVDLTIKDLPSLIQQKVLLVEQTNNTISYHRGLRALVGAMKILERSCLVRTSAIK